MFMLELIQSFVLEFLFFSNMCKILIPKRKTDKHFSTINLL